MKFAVTLITLLAGCSGEVVNIFSATDPIERGLADVAAAIVTAAIIRAFFNH